MDIAPPAPRGALPISLSQSFVFHYPFVETSFPFVVLHLPFINTRFRRPNLFSSVPVLQPAREKEKQPQPQPRLVEEQRTIVSIRHADIASWDVLRLTKNDEEGVSIDTYIIKMVPVPSSPLFFFSSFPSPVSQ
jgi:hypothetical protein